MINMLRKPLLFLLLLSVSLLNTELFHIQDAGAAQQTGILWRIERTGVQPSYLLGTVHSDDQRVLQLPSIIREKLRHADSFVAELKMDPFSAQELGRLMFLPAGQTLPSLIGSARYQKCLPLLAQYGIPAATAEKMQPWAVSVTLSMPKSRTGMVLDQQLYQDAEMQGKQTYGLESNREQIAVFESFSLQQQIMILDDALAEFDRLPMLFDELLHYYLQRDLTGLERISEKYMQQGNHQIAKIFKQKALLDRNYLMVRRMQVRLLEGNSFIAVGALHLPGDEGILRLLEKEGYKVTAVY